MTPTEAAALLQLSAKTVIKLANEGKIPGKKFGERWRFVPSVLETFLKDDQASK